ncbi:hypothetical protein CPB86DRAFT_800472 [Serendipita vermifera]|nr:hypothetical protein CPB86DRAFT_800472 [Serendipita vermifera]
MSNYMGGARNTAKRRHGNSARFQKAHFNKTFTSRGFGAFQASPSNKVSEDVEFDLLHAKNASTLTQTRPRHISPPTTTRIDSVDHDWITGHAKFPIKGSNIEVSSASLPEDSEGATTVSIVPNLAERRERLRRILDEPNLVGLSLPQVSNSRKKMVQETLPQSPRENSSKINPEVTTNIRSSGSSRGIEVSRSFEHPDDSKTSVSSIGPITSMVDQMTMAELFEQSVYGDVNDFLATNFPYDSIDQDSLVEHFSLNGVQPFDDILSFPATPVDHDIFDKHPHGPYGDRENFEEECTYPDRKESPMLLELPGVSTFTAFQDDLEKYGMESAAQHEDEVGSWESTERLRLPHDKSGVGMPLRRWVCDGSLQQSPTFLVQNPFYEEDDTESQSGKSINSGDWLYQPYEAHLFSQDAGVDHDVEPTPTDLGSPIQAENLIQEVPRLQHDTLSTAKYPQELPRVPSPNSKLVEPALQSTGNIIPDKTPDTTVSVFNPDILASPLIRKMRNSATPTKDIFVLAPSIFD